MDSLPNCLDYFVGAVIVTVNSAILVEVGAGLPVPGVRRRTDFETGEFSGAPCITLRTAWSNDVFFLAHPCPAAILFLKYLLSNPDFASWDHTLGPAFSSSLATLNFRSRLFPCACHDVEHFLFTCFDGPI